MGVIPTGSIFKTLTFDGKSSSEFNVYITGEGVFNAPERAVEMISIPGRNGAFALDYGRFENIEVTYTCGIAGDNDADFASAISDFRNWLCSRNGYVRLSDDYNTGEYRMAIYKSGLEVTAENLKAGEFPIVFECKPQRFLTSGEDTISVTSGDTITNPTLFESLAQLQIYGYGTFYINNTPITVTGTYIGDVPIYGYSSKLGENTWTITVQDQYANNGDTMKVQCDFSVFYEIDVGTMSNYSSSSTGNAANTFNATETTFNIVSKYPAGQELIFNYGIASTDTNTVSVSFTSSSYGALGGAVSFVVSYDGGNAITFSYVDTFPNQVSNIIGQISVYGIILRSTQNTIGNPIYIDLNIGEAYKIENDIPVSVNNAVIMPAELPMLAPGANTITYDNTITSLDIVPRWWKI